MIAALFVAKGGTYYGLDGVDPWDEERDARLYAGPHPVVAHPPCSRWCRLAGLVEARWGHRRGEDGGCFAAALRAVETYGGVLEHPAYSDAWGAFDLPVPLSHGGWVRNLWRPGWACYVEQHRYGHPARKATWLYAVNVELPELRWGQSLRDRRLFGTKVGGLSHEHTTEPPWALVSWCGNHTDYVNGARASVGKKQASATPVEFRDVLLAMARTSAVTREVAA